MSFDLEFQKVLYTSIDAAVSCDVEAQPVPDRELPYVEIGETTIEEHPTGHLLFADVHVWSNTEGPHETKALQHIIRNTLHAGSFIGGGFSFSCCREADARVIRDKDDEHWHGVQTFRVIVS